MNKAIKKTAIAISVLLLSFGILKAQPFTLQNDIFPAQTFSDIEWADYDNDSDLDYLIMYNTGEFPDINYFIKVFENLGSGSFSEAVSIPTISGGNSISWIDFDKDGNLDILHVSGSFGSKGVELYKNNGNKVFTKIADSFIDEYDGNNVVVDLNNDNYPDIIYNGHMTTKTYIYLNNGNATFSELTNHPIIALCYGSIDCADFDGNGFQDILISGKDFTRSIDYTKVFKNNGNNTFSEIPFTFTGVSNNSGVRGTPSRWADYNNDGNIDVVQVGNGYIYFYKNTGNSSFIRQDSIAVETIDNGSVSLGDYDNDGDLDILVSGTKNPTEFSSKVFRNMGGGSFEEDLNISLSDQVHGITHWIDYDSDGDLDIVLQGLLYRNDGLNSTVLNLTDGNTLKIYPNPVSDVLHLVLKPDVSNAELFVFNVSGKMVEYVPVKSFDTTIDLSYLDSGAYIAVIRTGSGVKQYKLIKQ